MNKNTNIIKTHENRVEMPGSIHKCIIEELMKSPISSKDYKTIDENSINQYESEIEAVKDRLRNAVMCFSQASDKGEIPQKIEMGNIVTLMLCLQFLEETNLLNEDELNLKLTNCVYGGVTDYAIDIIRKYDEFGNYKGSKEEKDYHSLERAKRCCNLMYEYLNNVDPSCLLPTTVNIIKLDRPKMDLRISTQKNVLQVLKEINFDDELTEGKTEKIKNEIKKCYEYLLLRDTENDREINITYLETLKKCLNLLKKSNEIFNNEPDRINIYGDYLKRNISGASKLINIYDKESSHRYNYNLRNEEGKKYIKEFKKTAAICCSLAYQIINSAEK